MIRLHVLVEGQSEERFVKDLLHPHLLKFGVQADVSIVKTRSTGRGPANRGGGSASQYLRDLKGILQNASIDFVSTVIDFYGFPLESPPAQLIDLEHWLMDNLQEHPSRLIPFFAKHEFEAWLFSDPEILVRHLQGKEAQRKEILGWLQQSGPEELNTSAESHPKARLKRLFRYMPLIHAVPVLEEIGLARIRMQCPHFNRWLNRLENLAS